MSWLMLFSLCAIAYLLIKIVRFFEWIVTGEGEEIKYSDLPEGQIIDVLVGLNENRRKMYERDIFSFTNNDFKLQ